MVVLISSLCSGRMKLDSSVSMALLLQSESTAERPDHNITILKSLEKINLKQKSSVYAQSMMWLTLPCARCSDSPSYKRTQCWVITIVMGASPRSRQQRLSTDIYNDANSFTTRKPLPREKNPPAAQASRPSLPPPNSVKRVPNSPCLAACSRQGLHWFLSVHLAPSSVPGVDVWVPG